MAVTCQNCDGRGYFAGPAGIIPCYACKGSGKMRVPPFGVDHTNRNVRLEGTILPAGQRDPTTVVVGMDGRPFVRERSIDPTPQQELAHGLTQITESAMMGDVTAMYGIAEVRTTDGPRLVIVQYGVPTDKDQFSLRLLDIVEVSRRP